MWIPIPLRVGTRRTTHAAHTRLASVYSTTRPFAASRFSPKRPEDTSESNEVAHGLKRAYQRIETETETVYVAWGRTMSRLVDTFHHPLQVISVARKFGEARRLGQDLSNFSPMEHFQNRSYELLMECIPALHKKVAEMDLPKIKRLTECMKIGQDAARITDTRDQKRGTIEILQDTQPVAAQGLKPDIMITRGFNHPLTGRLMCPVHLNYDDPDVRRELERSSPRERSEDTWPAFLYKDWAWNRDNAWEGLLQSELLVQCYKMLFLGRSSWDKPDGSHKPAASSRAALLKMESVTARSLAYLTTIVYFSLSSRGSNSRTGGLFNPSGIYWQLIQLLEDEDFTDETKALLNWWSKRVFLIAPHGTLKMNKIAMMKNQKKGLKASRAIAGGTDGQ